MVGEEEPELNSYLKGGSSGGRRCCDDILLVIFLMVMLEVGAAGEGAFVIIVI